MARAELPHDATDVLLGAGGRDIWREPANSAQPGPAATVVALQRDPNVRPGREVEAGRHHARDCQRHAVETQRGARADRLGQGGGQTVTDDGQLSRPPGRGLLVDPAQARRHPEHPEEVGWSDGRSHPPVGLADLDGGPVAREGSERREGRLFGDDIGDVGIGEVPP
jgi:hypothetical protein